MKNYTSSRFTTDLNTQKGAADGVASLGADGKLTPAQSPGATANISTTSEFFDDFHLSPNVNSVWGTIVAGTGTQAQGYNSNTAVASIQDSRGWVNLGTSTTTTSGYAMVKSINPSTNQGAIILGDGAIDLSFRIVLPILSTGTQRYMVRLGLPAPADMAGIPTTDSVLANSIHFRYTDDENSGNWTCICRKTGVQTTINTSTAATVNETIFRIVIDAAATSVEFFIDGVSQGTTTTNIPSVGTAVGLSPMFMIKKAGIGTTARYLYVDYVKMTTTRT